MRPQQAVAAVERMRVHSITGHEWDCGECHYHFANFGTCPSCRNRQIADGEYDSTGRPVDHGELLSRSDVLAALRKTL